MTNNPGSFGARNNSGRNFAPRTGAMTRQGAPRNFSANRAVGTTGAGASIRSGGGTVGAGASMGGHIGGGGGGGHGRH